MPGIGVLYDERHSSPAFHVLAQHDLPLLRKLHAQAQHDDSVDKKDLPLLGKGQTAMDVEQPQSEWHGSAWKSDEKSEEWTTWNYNQHWEDKGWDSGSNRWREWQEHMASNSMDCGTSSVRMPLQLPAKRRKIGDKLPACILKHEITNGIRTNCSSPLPTTRPVPTALNDTGSTLQRG